VSLVPLTSNLGLLGYATASVLYLLGVQKTGKPGWISRLSFALFVLATVSVTIALVTVMRTASALEMSGLLLTSCIGWLAIGGHLQFNLRLIGAFVSPLATLILLMQLFNSGGNASATGSTDAPWLIAAHVALAITGEAFAIIACAVSVLYLWQQNLLKKKLLDQLTQNLPAIDRLDKMLRFTLWTGFIFITLGLLSGALYSQLYTLSPELKLTTKVTWAVLVWVWYLLTLLARNVFNRPSKRIAQMSFAGFLLLAVTYFGIGVFGMGGG
jgi:ABC-type uncharacterized transport system permease subunit